MLELKGVGKSFASRDGGRLEVLSGLDFELAAGEFVAVTGPSGCGKTTLLLIAGGLLAPESGTVAVCGRPLAGLSADGKARLRAAKVGFVFQQFHLIEYLNVLENVMAPAVALGSGDRLSNMQRAEKMVAQFDLSGRSRHYPSELSTGERQRVVLARALFNEPSLLLADEPTGNLDKENSRIVLEQLKLFASSGGSVMMVTHSDSAQGYADRTLGLDRGKLTR